MPRVDDQVDLLINPLEELAGTIADLLSRLPFATSDEKARIIRRIRSLLRGASGIVRDWADQELAAAAEEHDDKLLAVLGLGVGAASIAHLIGIIGRQLRTSVLEMSTRIDSLANRLSSPSGIAQVVHNLTGTPVQDVTKQVAKVQGSLNKALRGGTVELLCRDGRLRRYAIDYYVGLQGFMARQILLREVSIARTQQAGLDLVQVSSNPSTIGDFCDDYAGKVYSISGTDLYYPPLVDTPNGGPPFHPWCKHVLWPYLSEKNLIEE